MSAIFGIVHFDGSPVIEDHIEAMAAALAPHGDDGRSVWIDGEAGLGHLLRVITPEDRFERQPVRRPDGSHLLVFSGRLDNRRELLTQLSGAPMTDSREVPDSAIVSAALEQWGSACANRLHGDFVFVAWFEREKQIVAVRSPLSRETMFFFWDQATFAFASSPRGLFALPFVDKELDRERLADYVVHAPIEHGHSFFRDLRILETGCTLTVDSDGLRSSPFWYPEALPETRLNSDDEYLEAYLELFDEAVEARLRSEFPVSAMVSGGLDSSSVGCTAAPMLAKSGRRLLAFTQVPREGFEYRGSSGMYADETPLVQAIARKYENVDLQFVQTACRSVLDGYPAFVEATAAPFRNMCNRAWMEEVMRRAQNMGSRAILSGTFGNIAYSWEGDGVLPELVRRGRVFEAWRQARAWGGTSTFRTLAGRGVFPLLPVPLCLAIRRRRHPNDPLISSHPTWRAFSPLRVEFVQSSRAEERARDRGFDLDRHPDRDSRATRLAFLRETERLGSEIWIGMRALYGVEERDPTSDRRLVDFCLSIPESLFQRNGVSRRLTRLAMADRWPPEIVSNRRIGIQAADWHGALMGSRTELQASLDRLYSSPLAKEILDLDRMRKILDGIADAPRDTLRSFLDVHDILYLGLGLGQFFEWIEASAKA